MRLIDADALEYHEIDEIGGEYEPYFGCSKEYIDRQPTVCDIEQIRAEIKHLLNRPSLTHVLGYDKGFVGAIDKVLQIFDKYTKGENK